MLYVTYPVTVSCLFLVRLAFYRNIYTDTQVNAVRFTAWQERSVR